MGRGCRDEATAHTCVTVHGGAEQLCSKVVVSTPGGRGPFLTECPNVVMRDVARTNPRAGSTRMAATVATTASERDVRCIVAGEGWDLTK